MSYRFFEEFTCTVCHATFSLRTDRRLGQSTTHCSPCRQKAGQYTEVDWRTGRYAEDKKKAKAAEEKNKCASA